MREQSNAAQRFDDLKRFYAALDALARKTNGARLLSTCDGRMGWPERGVYFFQERGENRTDTGSGPRVVRVGTHGLKDGSKSTLWKRLSQHRGTAGTGGGNHRGSIFRLIVGTALMQSNGSVFPSWGQGSSAPRHIREGEQPLEKPVSKIIGEMPFLWLDIADEPGPGSQRGYIERNAIALLSNYSARPLDPPSDQWLGHHCNRERVRRSGLWNQNHVDEDYDPGFLDRLETLITEMR